MISPDEIKQTLAKALPGSTIETQDLTGGGDHWQVIIVSPAFEGKGLLEQHRMVNEALKEAMDDQRIHALALKTFSPAQWEKVGS
jgi:stress-induced morphogen